MLAQAMCSRAGRGVCSPEPPLSPAGAATLVCRRRVSAAVRAPEPLRSPAEATMRARSRRHVCSPKPIRACSGAAKSVGSACAHRSSHVRSPVLPRALAQAAALAGCCHCVGLLAPPGIACAWPKTPLAGHRKPLPASPHKYASSQFRNE
jgi:hypothetical protein